MSILYFTYGSNIHPVRLIRRISSIKLISIYILNNYRLFFNKKSTDGSSKCNIEFTIDPHGFVIGILYEISNDDLEELDNYEGLNKGYVHKNLEVNIKGERQNAITYIATQEYIVNNLRPYTWYKEIVISGMEYYNFDPNYIDKIRNIESIEDSNLTRRNEMIKILKEIKEYNSNPS